MTPEQKCDLFVRSLDLLDYDENGLTAKNTLTDLEAIAQICADIRAFTAAGDSPFELSLHRLVLLTEVVLTTYVLPDAPIVTQWVNARGELLELSTGSG
jgi:hypothetical protein